MVFQVHAISDVVEVDGVIWVVLEPGRQHLTNGKGQMLPQVMRHVHGEMECVQGVREDMYLTYILQTDIVGLMNSVCICLQFSVIRCSKTGH
jgi:hypothetical protein